MRSFLAPTPWPPGPTATAIRTQTRLVEAELLDGGKGNRRRQQRERHQRLEEGEKAAKGKENKNKQQGGKRTSTECSTVRPNEP